MNMDFPRLCQISYKGARYQIKGTEVSLIVGGNIAQGYELAKCDLHIAGEVTKEARRKFAAYCKERMRFPFRHG